ncbi:MAG TPA: hypothetical protein VFJ16_17660 [Longimicrobium sp.]|nr:hypothetical protein [Longimicrobium sp.]
MSALYTPPVSQLLALGKLEWGDPWLDYGELGITAEHVAELIRLLLDEKVFWADPDSVEVWGTMHIWRALGQLRAEAAIEPLLEVMGWDDEADWSLDEIPRVLGMIGPAALEPVRAALARLALDEETRWIVAASAANALEEIGKRFPEARSAVVDALQRQLRWWARQDEDLNASLVSSLVNLRAVEAAPVIEEAFSAGAVDEFLVGDWEDVQVELGLLAERITEQPWYGMGSPAGLGHMGRRSPEPGRPAPSRNAAAEAKRRRKAQKVSRQRNRKRKKR